MCALCWNTPRKSVKNLFKVSEGMKQIKMI